MNRHLHVIPFLALTCFAPPLFADPSNDKNLAAAQAALNKEVLARPFSTEDYQSVEVYIRDRHARGLRPASSWRNDDDCEALTKITDYRDCQYFKRYYSN